MSKYTPKQFFPNVRTEWAGILNYIDDAEKADILTAIFKYPDYDCKSSFWLMTIKPDIDRQKEIFTNKCQQMSDNRNQKTTKVDRSQPKTTEVNQCQTNVNNSQPKSTSVDNVEIEKEKEIERKKVKSVSEQTEFSAGYQNWTFPAEIISLAKKFWKPETIRNIEIDFSCREYSTMESIEKLLTRYPADTGTQFQIPDARFTRPWLEWLDYKKSRKETYKNSTSLQKLWNQLIKYSNNDPVLAQAVVDQSIANNYAGLFELKGNRITQKTTQNTQNAQKIAEWLNND